MGAEQEIEFKNIIQAVVQKLIKLFSVDSNKIDRFVRTEYSEGINEAEEMFQMNFIPEEM